MRFITRLLSVGALGLAIGLATTGAASAQVNSGPPQGCQQGDNWSGMDESHCCPSQGQDDNIWGDKDQSQCCPSQHEGDNNWSDNNWGDTDQSQCCPSQHEGDNNWSDNNWGDRDQSQCCLPSARYQASADPFSFGGCHQPKPPVCQPQTHEPKRHHHKNDKKHHKHHKNDKKQHQNGY